MCFPFCKGYSTQYIQLLYSLEQQLDRAEMENNRPDQKKSF